MPEQETSAPCTPISPHPVNFPDIKDCGWHSCIQPRQRVSVSKDRMPCNKKKQKPDSVPCTYSVGQLTCSVQDEDARTVDAELRSVPPDLGPKRHIATQITHAQLQVPPTEQSLVFMLGSHHW
ncbi:hypothetical protein ABVT39_023096 [Epinephelus coioides]